MKEEDYINLQNLLIKLRVRLLKELDSKTLPIKQRDKDYRMLRSVDNLRKNVEVITNEITIGIDMGSGKDKHIESTCSPIPIGTTYTLQEKTNS